MLCARECPDWCIYIDSHKETIPATTEGGRDRQRNVLDRFAIDFSLCMYCGICIEVCPFDALHWSPQFEYAEVDILDLLHEKDRLGGWMATVPPPPALDEKSAEPAEVAAANKPARGTGLVGGGSPPGGPGPDAAHRASAPRGGRAARDPARAGARASRPTGTPRDGTRHGLRGHRPRGRRRRPARRDDPARRARRPVARRRAARRRGVPPRARGRARRARARARLRRRGRRPRALRPHADPRPHRARPRAQPRPVAHPRRRGARCRGRGAPRLGAPAAGRRPGRTRGGHLDPGRRAALRHVGLALRAALPAPPRRGRRRTRRLAHPPRAPAEEAPA